MFHGVEAELSTEKNVRNPRYVHSSQTEERLLGSVRATSLQMLKSQHADPIRVAQLTAESLNASKTAGGRRDLPEHLQTSHAF